MKLVGLYFLAVYLLGFILSVAQALMIVWSSHKNIISEAEDDLDGKIDHPWLALAISIFFIGLFWPINALRNMFSE